MDVAACIACNRQWPCRPLDDIPSGIFRRHVLVNPFCEEELGALLELIGPQSVVYGSDFPHPEGSARGRPAWAKLCKVTANHKGGTMEDLLGLSDRYALVVGGGRGIGREAALLLAQAGAHVAVEDIIESRADAVAKEIADLGVQSLALTGDAQVPADVQRFVDQAADFAEDRLEILINIVGLATWKNVMDVNDEEWDEDLNINLRHHLYVSRAVARKMIDAGTGGRMAMIASVDAFYASTNHAAYGVAKAGLVSLVKTMAQEWGGHGIRVNAVAPDACLTPRVAEMAAARGDDPNVGPPQPYRPIARYCTPREQATALLFFVSDLSSFVTGQTLAVEGGQLWVAAGRDPSKAQWKIK
jgi:NAD(P)-dependent dehydrogenase (short-subunit alcohol dehydrogenase family)